MLGKSAKLQWGLGYKSLKTIYEGALINVRSPCLGRGCIKKKKPTHAAKRTETDKH